MEAKYKLVLILSMLVLAVGLVNAVTVTITAPTTSMAGNYNVTVTAINGGVDGQGNGLNLTNCSASFTSASTSNSSAKYAFSNASSPDGNSTFVILVNTLNLEDSNDYLITVRCMNASGDSWNDTESATVVDNTVPAAPTITAPANGKVYKTSNAVTATATVGDSTTTGAKIIWRDSMPAGKSYTDMTCSGSDCTAELTAVPSGDYYWIVRASDGTNTTDAAGYIHFLMDYQGKTGAAKVLLLTEGDTEATGSSSGGLSPLVKIILIAAAIYLVVHFSGGNKGKKKR